MRTFYVDTARSITSKAGKKYWKCSVVENNQNIINFANGKAFWAIEAEAYTILATIYWLIEQKHQGVVIIYSDCKSLVDFKSFKKLSRKVEKSQKRLDTINWKEKTKVISETKAHYFINLVRSLAMKNNLDLELNWVKGKENPADYYSRH